MMPGVRGECMPFRHTGAPERRPGVGEGVLAGMGRAKKLILALSALATVVGAFAVASGIYAVIIQQPYSVYYVLLMLGGYLTLGGMTCLIVIPYQFRMRELRRMQALDA